MFIVNACILCLWCMDGILCLWKCKIPPHVNFFVKHNFSMNSTTNQIRRGNSIFIVDVRSLCLQDAEDVPHLFIHFTFTSTFVHPVSFCGSSPNGKIELKPTSTATLIGGLTKMVRGVYQATSQRHQLKQAHS